MPASHAARAAGDLGQIRPDRGVPLARIEQVGQRLGRGQATVPGGGRQPLRQQPGTGDQAAGGAAGEQ